MDIILPHLQIRWYVLGGFRYDLLTAIDRILCEPVLLECFGVHAMDVFRIS